MGFPALLVSGLESLGSETRLESISSLKKSEKKDRYNTQLYMHTRIDIYVC